MERAKSIASYFFLADSHYFSLRLGDSFVSRSSRLSYDSDFLRHNLVWEYMICHHYQFFICCTLPCGSHSPSKLNIILHSV